MDAVTGKPVGSPLYHAEERLIRCHAFSPDGRFVATGTGKIPSAWTHGREGGDEGEVRVWDTTTSKLLVCKSFPEYVTSVIFSPNGKAVRVQTDPINGR
ncbi:MAG: WD40 repeat domain-containing protein [Thermoguttaceae bacterium]